jgi:hypothetical protein
MKLLLNNVTPSVIKQLRREGRNHCLAEKYGLETTFSVITLGPSLTDQEIVEALEGPSDGLVIAVIRFCERSTTGVSLPNRWSPSFRVRHTSGSVSAMVD